MAHVILAYPNRAEAATLSGGDWEATLPLANLQDTRLHLPARTASADASDTQLDVAFSAQRPIGLIVLYRHNLSLDARVRIRGGESATFATSEYDSGWVEVYGTVYDGSTLIWESENWWTGQLTEEERAGFPSAVIHVLPSIQVCRYWRIEIDDESNADGYIEISRLWVSETWSPVHNMSYGASLSAHTDTQIATALSGAEYADRRDPYRVYAFSLEWLSDAEAYQRAFEVQWRQGIDREVFVVPDPDDAQNLIRRAFLGRLERLNPIEHPSFAGHTAAFTIKERL